MYISLVDEIIQSIIILWRQVEPILGYEEALMGVGVGGESHTGQQQSLAHGR